MARILLKRAYDPPARADGRRFLVERLWPRGVTREALAVEAWLKDLAPSAGLRKWYGHDPAKWPEFRRRYLAELANNAASVKLLREAAQRGPVALVFAARDPERSSAAVLRTYLERGGAAAVRPGARVRSASKRGAAAGARPRRGSGKR